MKKATYILAGVGLTAAVFAGVFGALEMTNYLDRQRTAHFLSAGTAGGAPLRTVNADETLAVGFDFKAASQRVMPSVVSIDKMNRTGFYDEEAVSQTGTGSGVILTSNGIIVTNNHVVQGFDEVKVRTPDQRTHNARVLGTDPRSDLAVLKIDASGLTPIQFGDSAKIEVGEWVLAVGNPLGFDNTVSVGVVSSLKRSLPVGGGFLLDAIQTDAAINPGNSGGALADAQGRLIGINTAIASPAGPGSVGIGFAIPINRVRQIVDDIVKLGYARYAGLGIRYNPNIGQILADPQVRRELARLTNGGNVPEYGIIVKSPYRQVPSVEPGGAADTAGIQEWDIIMEIDGQRVTDGLTLNQVLIPKRPGDVVTIRYWSRGNVKSAKVKLQELRDRV
jgi:serine protease Do